MPSFASSLASSPISAVSGPRQAIGRIRIRPITAVDRGDAREFRRSSELSLAARAGGRVGGRAGHTVGMVIYLITDALAT
jgi:hypothetical protein